MYDGVEVEVVAQLSAPPDPAALRYLRFAVRLSCWGRAGRRYLRSRLFV